MRSIRSEAHSGKPSLGVSSLTSSASAFAAEAGGFSVLLPVPPSVNAMYAGKSRRYKASVARSWDQEARWQLNSADPRPVDGRYALLLVLSSETKGDLSNRMKAMEDLLAANGHTSDDRYNVLPVVHRDSRIAKGMCLAVAVPADERAALLRFLADQIEFADPGLVPGAAMAGGVSGGVSPGTIGGVNAAA